MKCFYNPQDFSMRLQGGLAIVRGEPAVITRVEGTTMRAETLSGERLINVQADEIDLSPLQLGNITNGVTYCYVARKPWRKSKQTLSDEALFKYPMPFNVDFEASMTRLKRPILNKYKPLDEVLRLVVSGKATALPFHREWGVYNSSGKIKLVHKNDIVGEVKRDKVELLPEKFYLKESLEEVFL